MAKGKSVAALILVGTIFAVAAVAAVAVYMLPPASGVAMPNPATYSYSAGPGSGPAGLQVTQGSVPVGTMSATAGNAAQPEQETTATREVATREVLSSQPTSTPVAEAVAPLGDKFVRAFHFVGATENWVYYDPEVPEEGSLRAMVSGQTYLILVSESITVETNGQRLELVCSNNDCWNTIVWP